MRFVDLHLDPALLQAIAEEGYERPTPIQARAIPPVAEGRDVLGIAQTGTGKTAAFALPILHRLAQNPAAHRGRRNPRVLVVAPTRELAAQIGESFRNYGRHLKLSTSVIFGGVGQRPQEDELHRGVDILVACPGRLLDLVGQGHAKLGEVEILVLDEADRMMDMGFLPDIKKIIARVPKQRQTLFFSATMPPEIQELSSGILTDPITVAIAPAATAAETVEQKLIYVDREGKQDQLERLLEDHHGRVLVFTRTKHGADRVVRKLDRANIKAMAIHGDKSQGARTKALEGFRDGSMPILVASDIAARGLDIDEIQLVVNYDVPADPDTYVHRIGRTGRAGASGMAVTFITNEDNEAVRDIEKRIARPIPREDANGRELAPTNPAALANASSAGKKPAQPRQRQRQGRQNGTQNSGREQGSGRGEAAKKPQGQDRSRQGQGSRGADDKSRQDGGRSRGDAPGQARGDGRKRNRGPRSGERRDERNPNGPSKTGSGQPTNLLGRIWNRLKGNSGT